jgi:ATP-dependent Zn protease
MLAASPRPLAEVLIDALHRGIKLPLGNVAASEDDDSNQKQLALPLGDLEPDDNPVGNEIPVLRPDEIAAAVLLGRALDLHRALLARLQDSDTVTVIAVPVHELVEPIARLLRIHVVGTMHVMDDSEVRSGSATVVAPGTVALFHDSANNKGKSSDNAGASFATAVQRRCAIVGLSAEPDRLLPRDLPRLAETRIIVPPLDGEAIAAVIAAITGKHPGVVDEALAARVTLDALNLAVRADLGAESSLARLRRLLAGVAHDADAGPLLSEMHGLGDAKQWGLDLVADLRAYVAGKLLWEHCPKGLLLTGRPGTGKTSFARALAREARVHFIATSYAQWQSYKEGHLGNLTQAIRNTFFNANANRPCIVFIDEIDSMPARGSTTRDNDWWTAIINVLLECLDGYEKREGVVVIGACNDPSRLDPALVRPGRLDKHIEIPLPDLVGLIGILRAHLRDDLSDADLRPVAVAARGRTGADIELFVREARGRARRRGDPLTPDLLLDAVRGGAPKLPAAVRKLTAYHEAGHAIATLILNVADPVALSIDVGGGGLAESEPGEIRNLTRGHLENYLVALLAGRAAEELAFGEVSAGAGGTDDSDIAKATWLATRIETAYGLGRSGLLWVPTENSRELLFHRDLHEAVRGTLDKAYTAAKALIATNRASLNALAAALIDRGYLDRDEIHAILAQVPLSITENADAPPVQAAQTSPVEAADGIGSNVADEASSRSTAFRDP